MRFQLFEPRPDAHIRKAREYLNEAHLARIEHQVAAEHHLALARMYSERVARLEAEISNALQPLSFSAPRPPEEVRAGAEPTLFPVPAARAARS
jgi:hypothetical protein